MTSAPASRDARSSRPGRRTALGARPPTRWPWRRLPDGAAGPHRGPRRHPARLGPGHPPGARRPVRSRRCGHRAWPTSDAETGPSREAGTAPSASGTSTTRRLLRTLEGHGETVSAVDSSPDGTRVVSASWDGTLRLWDLRGGVDAHVLEGHEAQVTGGRFSPDGRRGGLRGLRRHRPHLGHRRRRAGVRSRGPRGQRHRRRPAPDEPLPGVGHRGRRGAALGPPGTPGHEDPREATRGRSRTSSSPPTGVSSCPRDGTTPCASGTCERAPRLGCSSTPSRSTPSP